MKWVLLVFALLASPLACAHAPGRSLPPPEIWPACASICEEQNGSALGLLFPEPDEGPVCVCTRKPWST